MQEEKDVVPQWITAHDLLIRLKDELIGKAIALLHKEESEGRIKISGTLMSTPDKNSENENDMFILNNITAKIDEMHVQYESYLSSNSEKDPALIKRIEDLKKFLMAMDSINILVEYSKAMDPWIDEAALEIKSESAAQIIADTASRNPDRVEILNYICKNSYFRNEVLSKAELEIVESAARIILAHSNKIG
ncbi:MAG: hypothetical protein LVQ97_01750 [Candidatus Micrarchaeales archaeon]|jgi:hypothetical protein|uniref:Uncharacterized protein n=1 Tax=Candidatus Micrarchaeum acidiphilum ARMAN-2 TaxID=425595 RepID=C7DI67_MICA2|nr:MAG: hypothetical protein UNLARM2_0759 [Candidatus Micrarchaeum acidiphilum ARMAN-2]MCW6160890.1 hypothetical protein [Candidatus Micrarchaeales archaeon]